MENITEKQSLIIKVLSAHPCQTSKSISYMIKRECRTDVSQGAISAFLNRLQAQGKASSSNCGNSAGRVYWL